MRLIGQAHTLLHEEGVPRIQTDIRVGSRCVWTPTLSSFLLLPPLCFVEAQQAPTSPSLEGRSPERSRQKSSTWLTSMCYAAYRIDKQQKFEDKVRVVEDLLAVDNLPVEDGQANTGRG